MRQQQRQQQAHVHEKQQGKGCKTHLQPHACMMQQTNEAVNLDKVFFARKNLTQQTCISCSSRVHSTSACAFRAFTLTPTPSSTQNPPDTNRPASAAHPESTLRLPAPSKQAQQRHAQQHLHR
jgi:hypothetical protein